MLNRLGELHETIGNRAAALEYFNRFIALRQDADPELMQAVYEAREKIIQLIQ